MRRITVTAALKDLDTPGGYSDPLRAKARVESYALKDLDTPSGCSDPLRAKARVESYALHSRHETRRLNCALVFHAISRFLNNTQITNNYNYLYSRIVSFCPESFLGILIDWGYRWGYRITDTPRNAVLTQGQNG